MGGLCASNPKHVAHFLRVSLRQALGREYRTVEAQGCVALLDDACPFQVARNLWKYAGLSMFHDQAAASHEDFRFT